MSAILISISIWKFFFQLEDVVKKGMMDSFQKNYKADDLNNADVLSNAWNYMFLSVSVFISDMDDESPSPLCFAWYIY